MTTATKTLTLQDVLTNADPNLLADALRKVNIGRTFQLVKVVVAALTAASAIDITSATVKAAATQISGLTLAAGENLPPIGVIRTLRVTTASAGGTVGPYVVTDGGGTAAAPPTATAYAGAAVGVALIAQDGTGLLFPADITGFVIEYYPAPESDLLAAFEDFI